MSKKKKTKIPKPRNPFLIQMVARKQGGHTESKKAIRQREKAQLKRGNWDGDQQVA